MRFCYNNLAVLLGLGTAALLYTLWLLNKMFVYYRTPDDLLLTLEHVAYSTKRMQYVVIGHVALFSSSTGSRLIDFSQQPSAYLTFT